MNLSEATHPIVNTIYVIPPQVEVVGIFARTYVKVEIPPSKQRYHRAFPGLNMDYSERFIDERESTRRAEQMGWTKE